ncbi:hypothetical protein B0H19DRAFT_1063102 [Mycena capillaripes]|nr:hypothetical protein B0H19DRAFT_1063102 [Mycena capillaripes]
MSQTIKRRRVRGNVSIEGKKGKENNDTHYGEVDTISECAVCPRWHDNEFWLYKQVVALARPVTEGGRAGPRRFPSFLKDTHDESGRRVFRYNWEVCSGGGRGARDVTSDKGRKARGQGREREHQGIGQRPWRAFVHSPTARRNRHPLLAAIDVHPPHATLSRMNPFSEFAMSLVEYGPIDNELKHARTRKRLLFVAARLLAEQCPGDAVCLLNTQAVDIVCTCVAHSQRGRGVKVKVLPEEAHAILSHQVVNHYSIKSGIAALSLTLSTSHVFKVNNERSMGDRNVFSRHSGDRRCYTAGRNFNAGSMVPGNGGCGSVPCKSHELISIKRDCDLLWKVPFETGPLRESYKVVWPSRCMALSYNPLGVGTSW